jgi:uncharacterized protein (DUF1501 family)
LRRTFLRTSLMGLTAAMLPTPARAQAVGPRLFVIVLRGAADGLSLVSPLGATLTTLRTLRPTTAVAAPAALSADLGVHPGLAPLLHTSLGGRFSVVVHAGSPNASRSHEEQQHRLETGDAVGGAADGFLARASASGGIPSAAVSPWMPKSVSPGAPVVLLDPSSSASSFARYAMKPRLSRAQRLGLMQLEPGDDGAFLVDETARQAEEQLSALEPELAGTSLSSLTAAHGYRSSSFLSQRLAMAAALSDSSLAPRLVVLDSVEHWDTHAAQATNDANAWKSVHGSISDLGAGLAAFHKDLVARGLWGNSVVVVVSEFGRTVRENSAGGTDHGAGGAVLLLGGKVRPFADPAFLGRRAWTLPASPGPSSALAVHHDTRLVLCEVLERHMGMSSTAARQVFRGQLGSTPYLGVVA